MSLTLAHTGGDTLCLPEEEFKCFIFVMAAHDRLCPALRLVW